MKPVARIILALILAAGLQQVARADQYSCQTVDRSAVAIVNVNVPVSKFETNRRCQLSVDGATPDGSRSDAYVGAVNNLTGSLFFPDDSGDSILSRGMLVDLLTGPFSGGDGSSSSRRDRDLPDMVEQNLADEDIAMLEDCFRQFADMLGPEFAFEPVFDIGVQRTHQASCRVVLPASEDAPRRGGPITRDGALAIELDLGGQVLSLYFPAAFFRDARDGNGIFN